MQRRQFLQAASGTALAAATPAFIGGFRLGDAGAFTPLALSSDELAVDTFRDGYPGFVLRYESEGHKDSLESWIDETQTGRVHRDLESVNMLAVSMSWADAGRTRSFGIERFSGGLSDLEYVQYADIDAFLERPTPIDPGDLAEPEDVSLDLRRRDAFALEWLHGADRDAAREGLAFDEDAPEATLRDARELVRAGDDVIDGVDTSDVTVAVVDTGARNRGRYDDEEGDRRILDASTDFTSSGDSTVADDGIGAIRDGDGHGDWITSCVASDHDDPAYRGFAPGADILIAKSLGDDGSGTIADIVAGIDLAIDAGADVICLSLGSAKWSEAIADALEQAWEAGAFPVAASGNDRYATTFVAHPASTEPGLAVNATNVPESGDRDETLISYFGNVGPAPGTQDFSDGASADATPALAAPGMNIEITSIGTLTGTSMAAPMVGGAAALLAADGHDNETILERLTECAYPLEHLGVTESEYGLLDVEAALEGDEYDESQADVRSSEAEARDVLNEALAETRGRTLAGLI